MLDTTVHAGKSIRKMKIQQTSPSVRSDRIFPSFTPVRDIHGCGNCQPCRNAHPVKRRCTACVHIIWTHTVQRNRKYTLYKHANDTSKHTARSQLNVPVELPVSSSAYLPLLPPFLSSAFQLLLSHLSTKPVIDSCSFLIITLQ